MKRISLYLFVAVLSVTMSCQKNNKAESSEKQTKTELKESEETKKESLKLTPQKTELTWTAYKTTDKTPVNGTFNTLKFKEQTGNDVHELFNNLEFSIPVSSLFTNDDTGTRDPKIKESFFGKMIDPDMLKGKIMVDNEEYKVQINMNGETNTIPLKVEVSDSNEVTMTGTMELKDWKALDALSSLNEACFDLHKGGDGVSKTWEDVALEVKAQL
ncbi:MAG: hypothetical protein ACTJF0_10805 [Psychroflexus halocasei]